MADIEMIFIILFPYTITMLTKNYKRNNDVDIVLIFRLYHSNVLAALMIAALIVLVALIVSTQ